MCQLNRTLEEICNGYPFEDFSIGRKLSLLFFSHLFNKDFKKFDSEELRKLILDHTLLDSLAAYETVRNLFKNTYKVNLPQNLDEFLEMESVNKFSNQGDYLRYISQLPSPQELGKFNTYTREEIEKVKCNDSDLLKLADMKEIDLISFDPRDFGGQGKILSFRRKPLIPVLRKLLTRVSKIFVTSPDNLEDFLNSYLSNQQNIERFRMTYKFDPREDIQTAYTIVAENIILNICSSNKDMHDSLSSQGFNWTELESIKSNLIGLGFVDIGGFSYSGNVKDVEHLIASTKKYYGRYILGDRVCDNLSTMKKDSSYVIPLRGKIGGTYLETRFSPFQNFCYGLFGTKSESGKIILAHPFYKKEEDQRLFRNIGNSELFRNLTEDFVSLFSYTLKDLYKSK